MKRCPYCLEKLHPYLKYARTKNTTYYNIFHSNDSSCPILRFIYSKACGKIIGIEMRASFVRINGRDVCIYRRKYKEHVQLEDFLHIIYVDNIKQSSIDNLLLL